MHMRGTPQNMSNNTDYNNIISDLVQYFSKRIALAHSAGIKDIIIDPGFGFSKTVEQNYVVLKSLEYLHVLEKPILLGVSRKSMIYKTLNTSPEESLNGTTILNTIGLMKGTQILRVHDVKEAKEAIDLLHKLNTSD